MPTPLPAWQLRRTDKAVLREIDGLLNDHTDSEVAHVLNERGMRTYEGRLFTGVMVGQLRGRHGLKDHFSRMRAAGMLTLEEVASALEVHPATVKDWNKQGLLKGHPYNDKGQCLFGRPGEDAPVKYKHKPPKARASGTTI
jgi:hypothetical protein